MNARSQIIGNGCTAECPDWAVLWQQRKRIPLVPHPTRECAGSTASAINDRGQVAGWTFTDACNAPQNKDRAFVWQNGKTTFLNPLRGESFGQATTINAAGQLAGWSETDKGTRHAVLWGNDRRARDLGTLGGKSSSALGMNAHGHVVGWSETKSGERHAFLWSRGRMRDLGTLGGKGSEALAVNAHKQVIGISFAATAAWGAPIPPVHAFFWQNGKMTDLGRVADDGSLARRIAINDRGQVVGTREGGSRRPRAFLWANGRMSYLSLPRRATESHAFAINGGGQIVGTYEIGVTTHASLWQSGQMIDLGFLGMDDGRGTGAMAFGINDRGAVVGWSWHFMDTSRAVVWTQRQRN